MNATTLKCSSCFLLGVLLMNGLSPLIDVGRGHSKDISVFSTEKSPVNSGLKVPDCVEVGDLLLIDLPWTSFILYKWPGPHNEHGAIYVGNNSFVDAVEAVVREQDYSRYSRITKNYVFLHVRTATEVQRKAAAAWAVRRIGAPYQHAFLPPWFALKIANTSSWFPTADKLVCMELLWAAYYNQGIDIDQNSWRFPWMVTGDDILHDDDIQVLYENITNSTEITKPFKGVYCNNRKLAGTFECSLILGGITVEVVSYNKNITSVDFYLNGVYESTDDSQPYSWEWSDHASGRFTIRGVAYDAMGKSYPTSITVLKIF